MTNNHLRWKLVSKWLGAAAGLALLWSVSPILAGIFSVVVGLCAIAYWGSNTKSPSASGKLGLEEFRQHLEMTKN